MTPSSLTGLQDRLTAALARRNPEVAMQALGPMFNREPGFARARLPRTVEGFEDLAFLFSSNSLNHGISLLTFEEAAFLFGAAREVGKGVIIEIGRFKGGTTFLLAAANPRATIHS